MVQVAIRTGENKRIAKSSNSWDRQTKKGDNWTTNYYYASLLGALRAEFLDGLSGRKTLNIDDIEEHIEKELKKFISGLKEE
jgi:hypothetical protein